MQEEIWKDVVGYEGLYQVSDFGNIKSVPRFVRGKFEYTKVLLKEVILSQYITKDGYARVALRKNRKYKNLTIHRAVALAFLPNQQNKKSVNHINGVKTDNRVENLEWATSLENTTHAIKMGLINQEGINNSKAKLTKEDVLFIRESNLPNKILREKFKVAKTTIEKVKNKTRYKNI